MPPVSPAKRRKVPSDLATSATSAPAPENRRASASPMPRDAPGIKTRAPATSMLPASGAAVGVDPVGPDEHRGPTLLGHHPVEDVPVVVGAASRHEDVSQQAGDGGRVEAVESVVRSDQRGWPFRTAP